MAQNRKIQSPLVMRAIAMTLFMAVFAQFAKAQVNTGDNYQVYMKEGNSLVARGATNVRFYDDHGPAHPSDGYVNYWDRWYVTDKHYTYVFRPKTEGDKIKVTFKKYTAYDWSNTEPNNCTAIGQFSLRINDDVLRIYNSDGVIQENLIAELTGTFDNEFTFMTDGPMTFEFISNEQFREEGWEAEVTAVENLSVQAPIIRRETCSSDILLFPSVPGATIYYNYTTDGTTPAAPNTNSTQYTGPITWPAGNNFNIKAIAVLDGVTSAQITKTFRYTDDWMPSMDALYPTITTVANTNTVRITCPSVPSGMNETFYVSYTTDNTEPTYNNGTKVFFVPGSSYEFPQSLGTTVHSNTYEFEVTTPNTWVRAKTFAYSCNNLVSPESAPVLITTIYVDEPTITFTTTNASTGAGTCTLGNIMTGATVYYTTDGSTPTTSSTPYTGTAFPVSPGQTVKAFAHIDGDGYENSNIVTEIYIPEGQSGGVYGDMVVLDDREDHSWSYYSDGDQPIHRLEPRDIKITYYGNSPAGRTTMTNASEDGNNPTSFSATATGVKVGVADGEDQDQFIYLKTLEAANENGSGGYPYTAIPNPFQVRPTYSAGGNVPATFTENFSGQQATAYNSGTVNIPTGWETDAINNSYYTTNAYAPRVSNNNTSNAGIGNYDGNYLLMSARQDDGDYAYAITPQYQDITSISFRFRFSNSSYGVLYVCYLDGNNITPLQTINTSTTYSNGWTQRTLSSSDITTINNYGGQLCFLFGGTRNNNTWYHVAIDDVVITGIGSSSDNDKYRGFYAWRIKSLSNGLTISGKSEGDIVYADEEITFETSNEEGNEVEFEALWAQAYVTTGTTSMTSYVSNGSGNYAKYQNAYERNFHVLTGSTTASNLQKSYPLTISSRYPDGSNGGGSLNAGSFTAAADTKFENISVGNSTNNTYTAANHDLIFGRGVTGTIYRVQGLNSAPTGNAQYTMRLESGTFTYVSWIKGYWYTANDNYSGSMTINGTNNSIVGVLGCDYDRAYASANPNATSGGNNNLTVTGPVFYGFSSAMPNQDVSKKSLDVTVKSGKFNTTLGTNMGTADAHECIYMGIAGASTNTGERKLTIEGGVLANVAGGVDAGDCEGNRTFTLRMRKGTVNGAIYGAGAVSPAYGDRYMVITGGTVKGWIGGGCNGVIGSGDTGGQTMGKSHVYVGGNVSVGGSATINGSEGGTVFGAGKGSGNADEEPESGRMSDGTNVVIADEATISNNVYGGGNYGFADEYTKMYVLGGTVQGSVYGGSNQNKGPVINIYMKGGTVTGNLYGGSNTSGTISDLATVSVSGGTVTNVFGGGKGSSTSMSKGTVVNVSGGTINNNVYGGGEEGTVTSVGTQVNVSGGTIKENVFGAGKGATGQTAVISGKTEVNVTGGTITKSVYGGGEAGNQPLQG